MKTLMKLGAAAALVAAFAAGASAGETIEEIVVIGKRPSWTLPNEIEQPAQSELEFDFNLRLEPAAPATPVIQLASLERRLG
jgi:hypothetical protein